MSCCAVSVGRPVEGPPRCTSATTIGVSIMQARPMVSIISEKPGPDVTVITFCPPQTAPILAVIEAISSSIWMNRPPTSGQRSAKRSAVSVDGVIG